MSEPIPPFLPTIPRFNGQVWVADAFAVAFDFLDSILAAWDLVGPEELEESALAWVALIRQTHGWVPEALLDEAARLIADGQTQELVAGRLLVACDRSCEGFGYLGAPADGPLQDDLFLLWAGNKTITRAAVGRVIPRARPARAGKNLARYCRNLVRIFPREELRLTMVGPVDTALAAALARHRAAGTTATIAFVPTLRTVEDVTFVPIDRGPEHLFQMELDHERQLRLQQDADQLVRDLEAADVTIALLPECVASPETAARLKAAVAANHERSLDQGRLPALALLVVGVAHGRRNEAWLIDGSGALLATQSKIHPWMLGASQQVSHGLVIGPEPIDRDEDIDAQPTLTLIDDTDLGRMLALICEDLAQCDPARSLVTLVGPTMVLGPILDRGLQVNRWACRAAAAIADDPGSLVLVATSLVLDDSRKRAARPREATPGIGYICPPPGAQRHVVFDDGTPFVREPIQDDWLA